VGDEKKGVALDFSMWTDQPTMAARNCNNHYLKSAVGSELAASSGRKT
jgi:hypothetical protein